MLAVIMAGGKGTRLSALTNDEIPKSMVIFNDKPILEWQLEKLKENGITRVKIVVGHLGNKIIDYFGDGTKYGLLIEYIEESKPLGTAGALFYLKQYLNEDHFLLIFGDVIFDIDITKMLKYHLQKNSVATLFVHPNSHPHDSDIVNFNNEGKITKFYFKNNIRDYWYDNYVNAGMYILRKDVLNYIEEPRKLDLEQELLFNILKDDNPMYAYVSSEYIKDIGTVERIKKALNDLDSGLIAKRNLRNKQKCIFIDRDGTINKYKGLIYKEEDFELEEGAVEAIKEINDSGYLAIVITNQPVVARGLCNIEEVELIHNKMKTLLGRKGAYIDHVEFCPHHPDRGYEGENSFYKIECDCRKPGILMIEKCIDIFNIDVTASWMIGDTTTDIKTGKNAGLKTALVLTGEAGHDDKYGVQPDIIGENLLETINLIIRR